VLPPRGRGFPLTRAVQVLHAGNLSTTDNEESSAIFGSFANAVG
jgi:hypothetical protein